MAHITADRTLETSTTTGTGAFTLAGAVTGHRAFGASMTSPSDTCWYAIWAVDGSGNATGDWETGLGTYSASNTLTRTTVLFSSNSNAAVSFSAGTKYVSITAQANKTLQLNNQTVVILPKATASSVTNPATDTLAFYNRVLSGRNIPSWKGPAGDAYRCQPSFWGSKWLVYLPNNGSTLGLNLGAAWAGGGTLSHPTPSTTSPAVVNQMYRSRWANVVTTTNQVLGVSAMASGQARYLRGNAARVGGFFFFARFIVELWPAATVRLFVGLSDQTSGVVASDTVAGNCIGLWHDTTDAATVLSIVTRDGTTTTKTSVGTLAASLAAGQAYDFYMYCPANSSSVFYRLDEINTGTTIADTSISTTLPTNTALMGVQCHMSNGTANTTVTTTALGISHIYVESDF